MNKENLVTIGTKIPLDYKHYLETIAAEQGISISELIRKCLPAYRKPKIPYVRPLYFGLKQPLSPVTKAGDGSSKMQKPVYFKPTSNDIPNFVLVAIPLITFGIILLSSKN